MELGMGGAGQGAGHGAGHRPAYVDGAATVHWTMTWHENVG